MAAPVPGLNPTSPLMAPPPVVVIVVAAIGVQDLGEALQVVPAGSFDEVIATARRLAHPGDAGLLSPACSCYDMFKNYEVRGERCRKAVEAR